MNNVFLTGVTGFLGKVILAELLRRRSELELKKVFVLVRATNQSLAEKRFYEEVVCSPCFDGFPDNWPQYCEIVKGDVCHEHLGINTSELALIRSEVTHIIHSAAAINFDDPLVETAEVNIGGSLNVLSLAQSCQRLDNMVQVSTTYVWPLPKSDIVLGEELVPLTIDPVETYRQINSGLADSADLLSKTGHVNTYTFTKCLAEHLLTSRANDVTLKIVRPSIISACEHRPRPGWIDSPAGYTGLVYLYGMGVSRVVGVHPDCRPDLVPCDFVVDQILDASLRHISEPDTGHIRHAVAGINQAAPASDIAKSVATYFSEFSTGALTEFKFVGEYGFKLLAFEMFYQRLPLALAAVLLKLTGKRRPLEQLNKLRNVLLYMNRGYRFVTHNTYVFGTSYPIRKTFDPLVYQRVICQGVYQFLLKHGEETVPLAGKKSRDRRSDFTWGLQTRAPNFTQKVIGYGLRKTLRYTTEQVTVNQIALKQALSDRSANEALVFVPNHRSYLDFLLLPYLLAIKPELGVKPPIIIASHDFARNRLMAWTFERCGALWVKRGQGHVDLELNRKIEAALSAGHPLMYFPEGTRNRNRQNTPLKRGILSALIDMKKPIRLVPITFNYDVVPEQQLFTGEINGTTERKHSVRNLISWLKRVRDGEIHLGKIHVDCAAPIFINKNSDPTAVNLLISEALQGATSVSTFHLSAFLDEHPVEGVDLPRLKRILLAHGQTVLESDLTAEAANPKVQEYILRNQWAPTLSHSYLNHSDPKTLSNTRQQSLSFLSSNVEVPENLLMSIFEDRSSLTESTSVSDNRDTLEKS